MNEPNVEILDLLKKTTAAADVLADSWEAAAERFADTGYVNTAIRCFDVADELRNLSDLCGRE